METLLPWLALKSVPGVGNLLFKRLMVALGSPRHVLSAPFDALVQVEGISARIAGAIRACKITDRFKEELDRVYASGFRIITYDDGEYPPLLREIPDPPPFLYIYGALDRSITNIAVVGSRNATRYGLFACRRLSAELVGQHMTIVSGMARGIDTAAHMGAIAAKGKTVAVLGSGLHRIYPPENCRLFHKIAETGAVISELPLDAIPEPHHFPARNRIISGMSLGTVVVEAAARSGSLITARMAAEQNREVFAVPGNIHSMKSMGTHNLIKQGAKLVGSAHDIMEELTGMFRDTGENADSAKAAVPDLTDEESRVMDALSPYPVHIDDLVRKIDMDPGTLSSILLQLELKGLVDQAPGKLFTTTVK